MPVHERRWPGIRPEMRATNWDAPHFNAPLGAYKKKVGQLCYCKGNREKEKRWKSAFAFEMKAIQCRRTNQDNSSLNRRKLHLNVIITLDAYRYRALMSWKDHLGVFSGILFSFIFFGTYLIWYLNFYFLVFCLYLPRSNFGTPLIFQEFDKNSVHILRPFQSPRDAIIFPVIEFNVWFHPTPKDGIKTCSTF